MSKLCKNEYAAAYSLQCQLIHKCLAELKVLQNAKYPAGNTVNKIARQSWGLILVDCKTYRSVVQIDVNIGHYGTRYLSCFYWYKKWGCRPALVLWKSLLYSQHWLEPHEKPPLKNSISIMLYRWLSEITEFQPSVQTAELYVLTG
jgi:hypothetical protein